MGTKVGRPVERFGKLVVGGVVGGVVAGALDRRVILQPETPIEFPALASEKKLSACLSLPPERAR